MLSAPAECIIKQAAERLPGGALRVCQVAYLDAWGCLGLGGKRRQRQRYQRLQRAGGDRAIENGFANKNALQ